MAKKPKPELIPLGRAIAKARVEAGYKSQAALAKELRITQQSVGEWETGITAPKGSRLQLLLQLLPELRGAFSHGFPESPRPKRSAVVLSVTQGDIDGLDEAARRTIIPLVNVIKEAIRLPAQLRPDQKK